jgi:hypothetical protein
MVWPTWFITPVAITSRIRRFEDSQRRIIQRLDTCEPQLSNGVLQTKL